MAERRRGGGGGGGAQAELREVKRQLTEAKKQIESLQKRLDREKGPIAVTADTAVRFDADPTDPTRGSSVFGVHPAECAHDGSVADLETLFGKALDALPMAEEPAPEPTPAP